MNKKYLSRKFRIDVTVSRNFHLLCDELALKKEYWARFFIDYEIEFLDRNRGIRRNTEPAYVWLKQQRESRLLETLSIKMTDDAVLKLDIICKRFNIDRAMLVEFALRSACERIPTSRKLSVQREDLLPLYLLEQSFGNRLKQDERMRKVKSELVIGTKAMRIPIKKDEEDDGW